MERYSQVVEERSMKASPKYVGMFVAAFLMHTIFRMLPLVTGAQFSLTPAGYYCIVKWHGRELWNVIIACIATTVLLSGTNTIIWAYGQIYLKVKKLNNELKSVHTSNNTSGKG
jgi:hypothetical protein